MIFGVNTPAISAEAASTPEHRSDELRADIRRLGNQLGETIRRNVSTEFFELVEQVRALAKETREGNAESSAALDAKVDGLTEVEAILLVRAFTIYFHLANVAEQVHRVEELRLKTEGSGELYDVFTRGDEAGIDTDTWADRLQNVEYRPVFTAHPTEASRRSVLEKVRRSPTCFDSATA